MVKDKGIGRPLSDHRSIEVNFHPSETHCVATVTLAWRDEHGAHRSRLARRHLRVSRSDLAGHATADALLALLGGLVRSLEPGGGNPADQTAVGPGAPVGATGATVTQDSLPGL